MRAILRSWAIVVVAIKRLLAQRWLALALVIGLITAIALVMSIPLYADAVYYRILQEELGAVGSGSTVKRPPFAYMFRYLGSTYGTKEWEEMGPLDAYLSGPAADSLGLPHKQTVRYFKTDNLRLFPTEGVAYSDATDPLAWVNVGFISEIEQHITILEGGLPAVAPPTGNAPVEVLMSKALAETLGTQVGEEYVTFRRIRSEEQTRTVQIPVQVVGIWQATDPSEEYWFYNLNTLEDILLVPEETYTNRIAPDYPSDVNLALWYLVMDGDEVTASDVGRILARSRQVEQRAATLMTNTQLSISPLEALRKYQRSSGILTLFLYAFSIPIIGLLLAFIGLVVGLAVGRQRNEIAVLRSRGASAGQVLGISGVEALFLGVFALGVGIPASFQVADLIGSTRSFLNFTIDADLRLSLSRSVLQFGFGALAVTLVAQVVPTFNAARHTIVTYKMEQARTLTPPWWQRAWLDVMLLVPAGYGIYLLQQQGGIALPGQVSGNSLFENPLLFLVPALGIFALTLVALRFLPLVMALLAWLAAHTNAVGLLLATRHLSRNRGLYTAPLILLVLTLSLSAFTTSLAQTLDDHLYDRVYYKVGADARLIELGSAPPEGGGEQPGAGAAATGAAAAPVAWTFVPVSEHYKAKDIKAATRFSKFDVRVQLQGKWQEATFYGIDRLDFPKVAHWRRDFAPATLGALMNSLAIANEGILLPQDFMRQNTIRVGDSVQVNVTRYGLRAEMILKVVGEFEYFTGWYPDTGPLMVGNLDYIFEQLGGQFPYDVLISIDQGVDYTALSRELRQYDINVIDWQSAREQIAKLQRLPERQGLFGVLSVGFLAAAVLTVLGFLLYTLFSFRRRFIELGTLRAIGLSSGQMTLFLAWELAFLILVGIGVGTLLGSWMSDLFIPHLQVGTRPEELTPPFLVAIAWPAIFRIYALFGILFVAALGALVTLLLRMKIFQAIKLGETV
ncbi:MAG: ABC transporter permease [Chloroflexi bacterium]|nr:ABC transporter permease [Chloroflexota bacterium]